MTVCNMTIKGGGRAGMITPDHTTLSRSSGARGARRGPRCLARSPHRRGGRRSTSRSTSTRPRSARWSRGAQPRHGLPVTAAVPEPHYRSGRARARVHGARARHADRRDQARPRVHRLVHELADRGSTRRRRVVKGHQVADTCMRWSSPARRRSRRRPSTEGLDEVFRRAGFDWRGAGCSMCLGMNPDIAAPGRAGRVDLEPELRGPPGARGQDRTWSRRRWRRRPRSRADSWTSGSGETSNESDRDESRARVSVLNRDDVDTDQIIPKQFLKRVERTGFGEFLFFDWAKEPGWDLARNPILSRVATSVAAPRASTHRGRSRTTAFGRSWRRASATSSVQLHQDRAARGGARGVPMIALRSRLPARRGRPGRAGGALRGADVSFEIDPEVQPPPARRARRHRADARGGRVDHGLRDTTASVQAAGQARIRGRYDSGSQLRVRRSRTRKRIAPRAIRLRRKRIALRAIRPETGTQFPPREAGYFNDRSRRADRRGDRRDGRAVRPPPRGHRPDRRRLAGRLWARVLDPTAGDARPQPARRSRPGCGRDRRGAERGEAHGPHQPRCWSWR